MSDRGRKGRNQKPVTIDDIIAQSKKNHDSYIRYISAEKTINMLKIEINSLGHEVWRNKMSADDTFNSLQNWFRESVYDDYKTDIQNYLVGLEKLRDIFQALAHQKEKVLKLQIDYLDEFNNQYALIQRYLMQIN